MTAYRETQETEKHPTLDELLADLDREELRELLKGLAARDSDLVDAIRVKVALMRPPPAGSAGARATVDPQAIRRRVSGVLHSLDRMRGSEAYWQVSSVVHQVGEVLDEARVYIVAGDGENALTCLEAITDEYVQGWTCLDDSDGYAGDFFSVLGKAWAEAALVADLSPVERQGWADKLTRWQAEIGDYGIDDAFDVAQAAFLLGWDHPPLQRVLRGEVTDRGVWEEGEAPWYAGELTAARLEVLDRQGRHQEYLYLAQAEGQSERYVLMLARLGRTEEAEREGLRSLYEPDQLLTLGRALRDGGELAGALRVGEHGLTLDGPKERLATWLCDLALDAGQSELALRAAEVAFRAAPNVGAYLRVQELAGEGWPGLREELLAHMRRVPAGRAAGQVEVFLHEGLLDDAIRVAERAKYDDLTERVMDAVVEHRPEWVIQAARREAEGIMDAARAKYYHHAVGWLERAERGYRVVGRETEWQAYLGEIRERHRRKHKLMEMLRGF